MSKLDPEEFKKEFFNSKKSYKPTLHNPNEETSLEEIEKSCNYSNVYLVNYVISVVVGLYVGFYACDNCLGLDEKDSLIIVGIGIFVLNEVLFPKLKIYALVIIFLVILDSIFDWFSAVLIALPYVLIAIIVFFITASILNLIIEFNYEKPCIAKKREELGL